jgi:hypothetical protein
MTGDFDPRLTGIIFDSSLNDLVKQK